VCNIWGFKGSLLRKIEEEMVAVDEVEVVGP